MGTISVLALQYEPKTTAQFIATNRSCINTAMVDFCTSRADSGRFSTDAKKSSWAVYALKHSSVVGVVAVGTELGFSSALSANVVTRTDDTCHVVVWS